MMAQLAWDPSKDAQALLRDYYQRAFGPAADNVRAYYEEIEKARMDFVEKKNYATTQADFPELYTADLFSHCRTHLDAANRNLIDAPEIYRKRLAFVEAGLQFSELLIESIALMVSYWDAPDSQVADKVRGNWKAMEQIPVQYPFSINWGPVRPSTPRMVGLHPDHPDPKRKVKPSPKKPNDLDQN